MTWDSQNRMASCVYKGTTSTFKYGADGLRRQATVNGVVTDYAYDGQTLVQEGFAAGGTLSTAKATYLQGPRGSECRIDETQQTEGYYRFDAGGAVIKNAQGQPIVFGRGATKWYVYDGLGSVVGEVDVNGSLTSSPKYDVYGLVRSNPGTASSAMGFVGSLGHLSEAGTGLIYMRARYYDPSLGRFFSQDPGKSGSNWFVYCDGNPVNKLDKTGKATFDANWWTSQAITMEDWGAKLIYGGLATCYTGCAVLRAGQWLQLFGAAGGPLCEAALAGPAATMQMSGGATIAGGLLLILLGAEAIKEGYYIENNADEVAEESQKILSKT